MDYFFKTLPYSRKEDDSHEVAWQRMFALGESCHQSWKITIWNCSSCFWLRFESNLDRSVEKKKKRFKKEEKYNTKLGWYDLFLLWPLETLDSTKLRPNRRSSLLLLFMLLFYVAWAHRAWCAWLLWSMPKTELEIIQFYYDPVCTHNRALF